MKFWDALQRPSSPPSEATVADAPAASSLQGPPLPLALRISGREVLGRKARSRGKIGGLRESEPALGVCAALAVCRLRQLRCWVAPACHSLRPASPSAKSSSPCLHGTASPWLLSVCPLFPSGLQGRFGALPSPYPSPYASLQAPVASVGGLAASRRPYGADTGQPFRLLAQTAASVADASAAADCAGMEGCAWASPVSFYGYVRGSL